MSKAKISPLQVAGEFDILLIFLIFAFAAAQCLHFGKDSFNFHPSLALVALVFFSLECPRMLCAFLTWYVSEFTKSLLLGAICIPTNLPPPLLMLRSNFRTVLSFRSVRKSSFLPVKLYPSPIATVML